MIVHAIAANDPCLAAKDVMQISCLEPLFQQLITVAASFAGILFFIMLIVGGFRCLFSGGNPKAVEGCKGTITAAVIGLVLVVSSYLILLIFQNFTGLNLTTFQIK